MYETEMDEMYETAQQRMPTSTPRSKINIDFTKERFLTFDDDARKTRKKVVQITHFRRKQQHSHNV